MVSDIKRDITKFDTVLLHSEWSSLRRKYWSKIPPDMNVLSCGPKALNILAYLVLTNYDFGNFGRHFPALHPRKSSQHIHACTAHDGAICSKNKNKIVPYYGDSPNTRNSGRLRSPSPIMIPGCTLYFLCIVSRDKNLPSLFSESCMYEINSYLKLNKHFLNIGLLSIVISLLFQRIKSLSYTSE